MEHNFYLVRDLSIYGGGIRCVGFFGMESAMFTLRLGVPGVIIRIADGVAIASTGENATALITWAKTHELQPVNPLEKDLSKSPVQEKVDDFDPPVRTGVTLTTAKDVFVRTGNISHFEHCCNYYGHQWVTENRIMRDAGFTFSNGGFATKACENCGGDLVVGMSIYLDGNETDLWVDACAGCGYASMEVAVHGMVMTCV